MENLFLSVTTHMKSKWLPLWGFWPAGQACTPAPGESQDPFPVPVSASATAPKAWRVLGPFLLPGTQEAPKVPAGGLVSVMDGTAQRGATLMYPEGEGSPGVGGRHVWDLV